MEVEKKIATMIAVIQDGGYVRGMRHTGTACSRQALTVNWIIRFVER